MKKDNQLVTYDYEGARISFRQGDDVMVNATEMAKFFNKRPAEWLRLPSTQEYISALSEVGKSHFGEIQTVRGGTDGGGTTWMHSNLALEFARWLSPKFGIWCNDRILELMQKGEVKLEKPTSSNKPKQITATSVRAEFEFIKQVKGLLNLSDASVAAMSNKVSERYDLASSIDYIPSNGKGQLLPATELLKRHNISLTAQQFNEKLVECGLLATMTRPTIKKGKKAEARFKMITDNGKKFGENQTSPNNPKETQPLWYADTFSELLSTVGIK